MAYKDEYEVARLYTAPEFRQKLERQFDGDYSLKVHLAPPMLSSIDPNTGLPRKREFGPWIFKAFSILAKLKSLRGTAFDVFGYTQERKTERKLIEDYAALLDEIAGSLAPENHGMAVQLARIPEQIAVLVISRKKTLSGRRTTRRNFSPRSGIHQNWLALPSKAAT
jgi:indolepyruvate ferredoxin oxidoreductase